MPVVVNAKDFDEPSNFQIKTATETEIVVDILFVISREKPTIVSSPPISSVVEPVVAEAKSNHVCRQKPLVPGATKPERGSTP